VLELVSLTIRGGRLKNAASKWLLRRRGGITRRPLEECRLEVAAAPAGWHHEDAIGKIQILARETQGEVSHASPSSSPVPSDIRTWRIAVSKSSRSTRSSAERRRELGWPRSEDVG
jgi:hypothetical protein